MRGKRQFRKEGELLKLGGVSYRLGTVLGSGGSSVVYHADYEDQLNSGSRHQVLIKELYPLHPKGLIYRNEEGNICCEGDGAALMERCRKSFYQGNQANLELLEKLPEKIAGNLNSYECYGTFYSVLSVHGGKHLDKLLDEGTEFSTLRGIAEGMMKILDAVDSFHRNRLLHLDISPDNILMLPERALLIDYNSIWLMDGSKESLFFSEKAGYTAPEVRLKEAWDVGPASDLYSVCAIMFRMMTGRILFESELMGKGLSRCFPKTLPVFQGEPVSASRKAVQIVTKGLRVLARKRYQSVDELRAEIRELMLRIDGKGISHSAVWEGSSRDWKKQKLPEDAYQERVLAAADGRKLDREACCRHLEQGGLLLLTGAGGMGKTRFLKELWQASVSDYVPNRPVTVYIPLAGYQEAGQENRYIRKYILRTLWFWEQVDRMEDGLHELERLLDQAGALRLVLLLDGLNEAGERRSGLLKEIENLGEKPGIGILITDRSDDVQAYGLRRFDKAELMPFTETQVVRCLEQAGLACPENPEFLSLLKNPMMLSLYKKSMMFSRESAFPARQCTSMDDMIGSYLESLLIHEQRTDSGNQTEQLRCRYLLQHFLPEIAGEMKRRKKTLLTTEEMYGLAERNHRSLSQKSFSLAFPEFLGKSRLMLQEIHNEKEWFDYAVTEQLNGHLNLIERDSNGNYRLVHDNFLGYLSEENRKNCGKELKYKKKEWLRKGSAALMLAVILAGAGGLVWKTRQQRVLTAEQQSDQSNELAEKQQNALSNVLDKILRNLYALGCQISAQNEVLKKASSSKVLEGSETGISELEQEIMKQTNNVKAAESSRGAENVDITEKLSSLNMDVSLSEIQDLYDRTYEMDIILENGQKRLKEKLCDPDSPYIGREKREPLVTAYEEYLEAYTTYVYLKLNRLLLEADEVNQKKVQETVSVMPVFKNYLLKYPVSNLSKEEAEVQINQAKDNLKAAALEMKKQNYFVPEVK